MGIVKLATGLPLAKIAAVALAASLVGVGVQTVRLARAQAALARAEAGHAQAVAAAELAARRQAEAYRFLEGELVRERERIDRERTQERRAQEARAAALRADRDGLRGDIADYAAGRAAAEDSLAACRERAATLGQLVEQGLRVQDELAAGAESAGADVRALLGWARRVTCEPAP